MVEAAGVIVPFVILLLLLQELRMVLLTIGRYFVLIVFKKVFEVLAEVVVIADIIGPEIIATAVRRVGDELVDLYWISPIHAIIITGIIAAATELTEAIVGPAVDCVV